MMSFNRRHNRVARCGMRLAQIILISTALSGCLLMSPFWGQTYASKSTPVKLQAWTTSSSPAIVFECSPAYHGGLYPFGGPHVWTHLATVTPIGPMYDSTGVEAFSASRSRVVPGVCWHYEESGDRYMAAIRARNSGSSSEFKVFDEEGIACLGQEVGDAGSWVGWIGKGCTLTYNGSTTEIPYVRIIANP